MHGVNRVVTSNGRLAFGGKVLKKTIVLDLHTIMAIRTNDLGKIIPEALNCRGVLQGAHHEFDVFEHTLTAVVQTSHIIKMCERDLSVSFLQGVSGLGLEEIFTQGFKLQVFRTLREKIDGVYRKDLFLLAVLLHDVGKPATQKIKEKDGTRPSGEAYYSFKGHTDEGVKLAQGICERSGLTKRQTEYITKIVENHKGPSKLTDSIVLKLDYANGITMDSFALEAVKNRIRDEIVLITLADNLAKGKSFPRELLQDLVLTLKTFIRITEGS